MSDRHHEDADDIASAHSQLMRLRSGGVDSTDPLVAFLYVLMRDYVVPGSIEEIMLSKMPRTPEETVHYSNGYLARYAMDIAERIHVLEP